MHIKRKSASAESPGMQEKRKGMHIKKETGESRARGVPRNAVKEVPGQSWPAPRLRGKEYRTGRQLQGNICL